MATTRKILIADPDLEPVRALTRVLRQRGYSVHYAPDGGRALEVAVLRHPDLILFDEHCRLLEARTFVQILRTNPRTGDIPVILTARSIDTDALRGFRDGWLKKPFNLDEVLGRIEHLFRRADAAQNLREASQELEGSLGQLGSADLLQVLAMNRRTGRLTLTREGESGELWVGEGRPVAARSGRTEGEKSLFRLLSWREGSFRFTPERGVARGLTPIARSMDDALLEGMRQTDEVARLMPTLPAPTARLQLVDAGVLDGTQHPITRRVAELLRTPRALQDVVDLTPASDLDVLSAIATLLSKGLARVLEVAAEDAQRPLLGPAEAHALRTLALRRRGSTPSVAVAKLLLCGGARPVRRYLEDVLAADHPEVELLSLRSGFGTVARLPLTAALQLDLCVMPAAEAARPLWRPFGVGLVGGLLLEAGPGPLALARHLLGERLPVVATGVHLPEALQVPLASRAEPPEALRSVLLRAVKPPSTELAAPARWPEHDVAAQVRAHPAPLGPA